MSKIKPHLRESLLAKIKKPSVKEEKDNFHLVISFKHLDKKQCTTIKNQKNMTKRG